MVILGSVLSKPNSYIFNFLAAWILSIKLSVVVVETYPPPVDVNLKLSGRWRNSAAQSITRVSRSVAAGQQYHESAGTKNTLLNISAITAGWLVVAGK